MRNHEELLRQAISARGAEDARGAPSFETVMARRTRARIHFAPIVAVAATLLIALWLLRPSPGAGLEPVTVSAQKETVLNWTSPTDFLLQTPGREVLEQVPSFHLSTPAIHAVDQTAEGASS